VRSVLQAIVHVVGGVERLPAAPQALVGRARGPVAPPPGTTTLQYGFYGFEVSYVRGAVVCLVSRLDVKPLL
jgi:hypothetical protein